MTDAVFSATDKFDLQQNYRRYLKHLEQYEAALETKKAARDSRVWVAGVIALVLAMASDFFLGVSAGLLGLYVYRMLRAHLSLNSEEEGLEEVERWFSGKGFKFEGRVLYRRDDEMLENPLDPFNDSHYAG